MADRERKIKESISRLANKANLQQNIRWQGHHYTSVLGNMDMDIEIAMTLKWCGDIVAVVICTNRC